MLHTVLWSARPATTWQEQHLASACEALLPVELLSTEVAQQATQQQQPCQPKQYDCLNKGK